MIIQPTTLTGEHVRLEPLALTHLADLTRVGLDDDLWKWIPTQVRTAEEMNAYIELALNELARGVSLPFAIVEKSSERAIGSTRYGNVSRENRRVEIGWTWVAREWQRTRVNTECKYLLLNYA
ncbi:MAG TPA: GNAT family N-acetyltransferase, partial [Candidatus Acidoferrales bacterium]|nr:GNAT family N-acetyltransferase [Candidatus Acidoferrales bacterium]